MSRILFYKIRRIPQKKERPAMNCDAHYGFCKNIGILIFQQEASIIFPFSWRSARLDDSYLSDERKIYKKWSAGLIFFRNEKRKSGIFVGLNSWWIQTAKKQEFWVHIPMIMNVCGKVWNGQTFTVNSNCTLAGKMNSKGGEIEFFRSEQAYFLLMRKIVSRWE